MSFWGLLRAVPVALAIGYLTAAAYVYFNQERLLFMADKRVVTPEQVGLKNVREIELKTSDGERLQAWFTPPSAEQPTVLFLHGNAGTIADRAGRYRFYTDHGLGVLMVEYRGFGRSTGEPSEAGLLADADAAYRWLIAKGVTPNKIVVAGESLGTGIAVITASRNTVAAVLLDAPYSSMNDVGESHYGWLPVRWLNKNPIDAQAAIGSVQAPILIQHGEADRVVPFALGRRLFDAAPEPKVFVPIAGAGHEIIFDTSTYQRAIGFLIVRGIAQ